MNKTNTSEYTGKKEKVFCNECKKAINHDVIFSYHSDISDEHEAVFV